jgi:hypothetical protein
LERSGCCAEFRVGAEKYKYKEIIQRRIIMMECVFIYSYVSIGLVGLSIIGMIVFAWVMLRRLRRVPRW